MDIFTLDFRNDICEKMLWHPVMDKSVSLRTIPGRNRENLEIHGIEKWSRNDLTWFGVEALHLHALTPRDREGRIQNAAWNFAGSPERNQSWSVHPEVPPWIQDRRGGEQDDDGERKEPVCCAQYAVAEQDRFQSCTKRRGTPAVLQMERFRTFGVGFHHERKRRGTRGSNALLAVASEHWVMIAVSDYLHMLMHGGEKRGEMTRLVLATGLRGNHAYVTTLKVTSFVPSSKPFWENWKYCEGRVLGQLMRKVMALSWKT